MMHALVTEVTAVNRLFEQMQASEHANERHRRRRQCKSGGSKPTIPCESGSVRPQGKRLLLRDHHRRLGRLGLVLCSQSKGNSLTACTEVKCRPDRLAPPSSKNDGLVCLLVITQ